MSQAELHQFVQEDISVIVPSYNSEKTIEACIQSLIEQSCSPFEIIVVDSSEDYTKEIIRKKFPKVHLIPLREKTFPGPARNIGAQNSSGRILAFIDSDCIARREWTSKMLNSHSLGHQVVGGGIEAGNFNSLTGVAGHLLEFREFVPTTAERYVTHIPSCNISYRRDIFMQFGGFPNSYYPQEDLLFNYLLTQNGVKIWFDPSIFIHHFTREGLRNYLSHQHRLGRVTRCVLKRLDLPGSFLGKHSILAWTSSPLLGVMKLFRTTWFLSSNYKVTAFRYPQIFLLLCLGSIWWARGFAAGARAGLSGIRGWPDPEEPIFSALKGGYSSPLEILTKKEKLK
jgi:glycosyltransferase involved in cell wall biosynthesis